SQTPNEAPVSATRGSSAGSTSRPTTSASSAISRRQVAEPMNPPAPVTAARRPEISSSPGVVASLPSLIRPDLYSRPLAWGSSRTNSAVASVGEGRRGGGIGDGARGPTPPQALEGPEGGDPRGGRGRAPCARGLHPALEAPGCRDLRTADVGIPQRQGPAARRPRGFATAAPDRLSDPDRSRDRRRRAPQRPHPEG